MAQIHVVKPAKTHFKKKESSFGIGGGFARSVVYLPRNAQNGNDAKGKAIVLTYERNNLYRFSLEFTKYNSINFAPTWYNVKGACIESNMYFIWRFSDNRSYFYPIAGVSYNFFSGYFTGKSDYNNLRAIYQSGSNVRSNWIGFNVGTGYEYRFKSIALFITQKMRVGYAEGRDEFTIQDLCLTFGLRAFLNNTQLNKYFLGSRNRYVLSKPKKKN